MRDGSYINVLLREVQFCNGEPYASKRPHDKLRVDFAHPVVAQKIKTHPDAALKILANPWGTHEEIDLPGSTSASAAVLNEADDFLDDSVFEEPCVRSALTAVPTSSTTQDDSDDFADDSVFDDPAVILSLLC